MKKIFVLTVALLLVLVGCSNNDSSKSEDNSSTVVSKQELIEKKSDEEEILETEPDKEKCLEIMQTFGAEPYEDGYQTTVLSFYYNPEGIGSSSEITPYGYYGWFLEYMNRKESETGKSREELFPEINFSETYTDDAGNDIEGIPAESFEKLVTSFFDVAPEDLRKDDTLYHAEQNAYWPIAGPGIGERPSVSMGNIQDDGEIISIEVIINEGAGNDVESEIQEHRMILTVRHDDSNIYEGYKFVSLIPKD